MPKFWKNKKIKKCELERKLQEHEHDLETLSAVLKDQIGLNEAFHNNLVEIGNAIGKSYGEIDNAFFEAKVLPVRECAHVGGNNSMFPGSFTNTDVTNAGTTKEENYCNQSLAVSPLAATGSNARFFKLSKNGKQSSVTKLMPTTPLHVVQTSCMDVNEISESKLNSICDKNVSKCSIIGGRQTEASSTCTCITDCQVSTAEAGTDNFVGKNGDNSPKDNKDVTTWYHDNQQATTHAQNAVVQLINNKTTTCTSILSSGRVLDEAIVRQKRKLYDMRSLLQYQNETLEIGSSSEDEASPKKSGTGEVTWMDNSKKKFNQPVACVPPRDNNGRKTIELVSLKEMCNKKEPSNGLSPNKHNENQVKDQTTDQSGQSPVSLIVSNQERKPMSNMPISLDTYDTVSSDSLKCNAEDMLSEVTNYQTCSNIFPNSKENGLTYPNENTSESIFKDFRCLIQREKQAGDVTQTLVLDELQDTESKVRKKATESMCSSSFKHDLIQKKTCGTFGEKSLFNKTNRHRLSITNELEKLSTLAARAMTFHANKMSLETYNNQHGKDLTIQELKDLLKRKGQKVSRLQVELKKLKSMVDTNKETLKCLEEDINENKVKMHGLKRENQQLTQETVSKNEVIASLETANMVLFESQQNVTELKDVVIKEVDEIIKKSTLTNQVESLSTMLSKQTDKMAEMLVHLDVVSKNVTNNQRSLDVMLKDKNDQLENLTKAIETLRSRVDTNKNGRDIISKKINGHERSLSGVIDELREIKNIVTAKNNLSSENVKHHDDFLKQNKNLNELFLMMNKQSKNIDNLREHINQTLQISRHTNQSIRETRRGEDTSDSMFQDTAEVTVDCLDINDLHKDGNSDESIEFVDMEAMFHESSTQEACRLNQVDFVNENDLQNNTNSMEYLDILDWVPVVDQAGSHAVMVDLPTAHGSGGSTNITENKTDFKSAQILGNKRLSGDTSKWISTSEAGNNTTNNLDTMIDTTPQASCVIRNNLQATFSPNNVSATKSEPETDKIYKLKIVSETETCSTRKLNKNGNAGAQCITENEKKHLGHESPSDINELSKSVFKLNNSKYIDGNLIEDLDDQAPWIDKQSAVNKIACTKTETFLFPSLYNTKDVKNPGAEDLHTAAKNDSCQASCHNLDGSFSDINENKDLEINNKAKVIVGKSANKLPTANFGVTEDVPSESSSRTSETFVSSLNIQLDSNSCKAETIPAVHCILLLGKRDAFNESNNRKGSYESFDNKKVTTVDPDREILFIHNATEIPRTSTVVDTCNNVDNKMTEENDQNINTQQFMKSFSNAEDILFQTENCSTCPVSSASETNASKDGMELQCDSIKHSTLNGKESMAPISKTSSSLESVSVGSTMTTDLQGSKGLRDDKEVNELKAQLKSLLGLLAKREYNHWIQKFELDKLNRQLEATWKMYEDRDEYYSRTLKQLQKDLKAKNGILLDYEQNLADMELVENVNSKEITRLQQDVRTRDEAIKVKAEESVTHDNELKEFRDMIQELEAKLRERETALLDEESKFRGLKEEIERNSSLLSQMELKFYSCEQKLKDKGNKIQELETENSVVKERLKNSEESLLRLDLEQNLLYESISLCLM